MLRILPDTIFNESTDKKEEIKPEDLAYFLNEEIQLENILFKRMFELILINHAFFDIVFYRSLGGFKILDFKEDFEKENVLNDFENVTELTLSWLPDLYYGDSKIPTLNMPIDFSAKNQLEEDFSYSLTFLSLSEYKNIPLTLTTNFAFYDKHDVVLEASRNMTLYEVIKAILFEITFYGSPNSRDIIRGEISKKLEELDDQTLRTLSFEDLFANVRHQINDDIRPV